MISVHPDAFTTTPWHLLLCKPNQNHIAFRHLTRLGFDLFMPRHHVERRLRGRVTRVMRPVFGGYIFASMGPSCPGWHKVKNTPGISSLVGFSTQGPAIVPAGVVAGLMSRCDHDGLLQPADDNFAVGDMIKITSGPFAEFVTTIEDIDADRRLHVLLELMGRPTKVEVNPAMATKRK